MSVYWRVYGSANDRVANPSSNATYSVSRDSTVGSLSTGTTGSVGQRWSGTTYTIAQFFPVFDTSTLSVGTTSARVSFEKSTAADAGIANDQVEIRAVSSTEALNKIAGGSLASKTPLYGSSPQQVTAGRFSFTIDVSSMPRASECWMVFHSQNERLNVPPTVLERCTYFTGDQTGTTQDPYLDATVGGWSFVGVSAVVEITTTTPTLTEPAGVADGDLLIACIASRTTATTPVTNTGWTAVDSQNTNNILATTSGIASGTMLYQIRAGTPDLTFVVPTGISVGLGRIVAYRGNATTTPLDVSAASTTAAGTTACSWTGLTTTQDDDLIVAMVAGGQDALWSVFNATTPSTASGTTDTTTAPLATAWIERADSLTTTGADTSLAIFDAVKTAAGATGNLTATASTGGGNVVIAGAFKIASSGPTAYTLPAVAGSYALTGTAALLERGREVEALAGSYALTGTAATLTKGAAVIAYNMPAAAGSYALTGATAGLYRGREVLAVAGSYALSGTAASLEYGREVASVTGSYALTGVAASLEYGREVLALGGSYAVSGTAAALRHDWKLGAVSGSYALTGTDATLSKIAGLVHRTLPVVAGSYTLAGTAASLEMGREVLALGGSYTLTGATSSLEYGREALALAGSYAITGTAASLEYGREVGAVPGSYVLTGAAATFRRAWKAIAVGGSYTLTGTPANLLRVGAKAIIGLPGSYALSGVAVSLEWNREVLALGGSYALSGQSVSLEYGREVLGLAGSYALSGTAASLERGMEVAAVVGSYALAGMPVNLLKPGAFAIIGLPGAYALTGHAATLIKPELVAAGLISVWNGAAWVDKPAKVWSGSAWMQKPVKFWNGSAWV